jgi:hypothetical protein
VPNVVHNKVPAGLQPQYLLESLRGIAQLVWGEARENKDSHLPSGAGDDAVLAFKTTHVECAE